MRSPKFQNSALFCLLFSYFLLCNLSNVEGRERVKVSADIVNAYIWRGQYVTGASIQPSVNFNFGNLQINTWGNSDIARGDDKEIDLMLRYTINNVTVGVSDYWISNEKRFNLFDFEKTHYLEVNFDYELHQIPLKLSWNTMFAGADKYDSEGKMRQPILSKLQVSTWMQLSVAAHGEAWLNTRVATHTQRMGLQWSISL